VESLKTLLTEGEVRNVCVEAALTVSVPVEEEVLVL